MFDAQSLILFYFFTEGVLLEVCLAKWWAHLGSADVKYSITFLGVIPEPKEVVLHGAEAIFRVDLTSRSKVEVNSDK